MQEPNIADAVFEEINEAQLEAMEAERKEITAAAEDLEAIQTPDEPKAKLSKAQIVKALAGAVEGGVLSVNRAKQIRQEMGIFQSDFTRNKVSDAKRKAKRKKQKASRKQQRK
jgi:hypothetical protein